MNQFQIIRRELRIGCLLKKNRNCGVSIFNIDQDQLWIIQPSKSHLEPIASTERDGGYFPRHRTTDRQLTMIRFTSATELEGSQSTWNFPPLRVFTVSFIFREKCSALIDLNDLAEVAVNWYWSEYGIQLNENESTIVTGTIQASPYQGYCAGW